MNKQQHAIWSSIAIVFAICITIYTLSYIVIQPWHVLTGIHGDGAKNDFTYLYQCIHGKGFWFDGMNYPYGEHIVYVDGQPSLSVFFTLFKNVTVGEALTGLWLLLGVSYVLSIIYLYKILIYFKVTPPVAIIFAGLIGIFSPQLFRIEAHYGLSYTCVVPMLFYWTIKYHEGKLLRYCAYVFVLGVIMAFFHPYFAALVLVWVLSYAAGYFIFIREGLLPKARHVLPLLITIVFVFAVIAVIMKITDPIQDRPVTPYGMLVYTTYKRDVVTSIHSPVWQYIHDHHMFASLVPHISEGGEGYSYIGLVTIAAVIFSLAIGIIYAFRKNKTGIIVGKNSFSPIWLFMAVTALLFSMGVPYKWHMEWLLDYTSFLKQFRSLGRFSWIFYYIITVYGVVVIYTLYAKLIARRKFVFGYLILLLSIGIWSYEASGYTKFARGVAAESPGNYDMFFSVSEKSWASFLQENHYDHNNFQAILMLAFFHLGSDKLWVGDPGWRSTLSCKAAFQLHIPMIDAYMARASWSQTEKQVKIAAGPFVDKPILHEVKSNKPFLLLQFDQDSLDVDQKYLLQASDYIGHYSQCYVYAFYPDRQLANDKKNADSINRILPFIHSPDTCIINKGDWYVNHLDRAVAQEHFFGTGAMRRIQAEDSNIAVIPVKPLADNQEYEFSCWFMLSNKDYASPCVFLESLDSAGNIIATDGMNTKWSVDNSGLWFRGSFYFHLKADCRAVRCRLSNVPNPSYKVMDEIMLRPSDALIISKAADGSVMVNNHLFKKDKGHE